MTQAEQALATMPEAPLITAAQAREQWEEYQQLKSAILSDDDYLWFLEWDEVDNRGRTRVKRKAYSNRADCEKAAKRRPGSRIKARLIKSACRKMAKFFGLRIPALGQGHTERVQEGDFIVSIERGDYYTHTEWMHAGTLQTIKASTTVFIVSSSGRSWMGRGGAHQSEGFSEDFAIGATSFTRAVNRAVLDLVGWGEETGEEMPPADTLPGAADKEPPRDRPMDADQDFEEAFGPPQPDAATEIWRELKALIGSLPADVPGRCVTWLKRRHNIEVPVSVFSASRTNPPAGISTDILQQLLEGLQQLYGNGKAHTAATPETGTTPVQQAWDEIREQIGKLGEDVRNKAMRWLAMTTGQNVPADVFDIEKVPLGKGMTPQLIYQLNQKLKEGL